MGKKVCSSDYYLTLMLLSFSKDVSAFNSNSSSHKLLGRPKETIYVNSLAQCLAQGNHLRNTAIITKIKYK